MLLRSDGGAPVEVSIGGSSADSSTSGNYASASDARLNSIRSGRQSRPQSLRLEEGFSSPVNAVSDR